MVMFELTGESRFSCRLLGSLLISVEQLIDSELYSILSVYWGGPATRNGCASVLNTHVFSTPVWLS